MCVYWLDKVVLLLQCCVFRISCIQGSFDHIEGRGRTRHFSHVLQGNQGIAGVWQATTLLPLDQTFSQSASQTPSSVV